MSWFKTGLEQRNKLPERLHGARVGFEDTGYSGRGRVPYEDKSIDKADGDM